MRVLQILDNEPWGGRTAIVHAIARALILRGDEVWVVSPDEVTAHHFQVLGAHVVTPPRVFRSIPGRWWLLAPFLFFLCRRRRFDLMVSHASGGRFPGQAPARLAGVPHIICHAHAFRSRDLGAGCIRRAISAWLRPATRHGDSTICVSDAHRRFAVREGLAGAERMLTIRDGIDAHWSAMVPRGTARGELGFSDGELVIGSIGRLEPGHGYEFLLYAMVAVLARCPAARLVIAGDGRLGEQLRQEAALLGIDDRVRFLGQRPNVLGLLPTFDVFVQPSLGEESSLSLLEAMAAGIPIVASDIPGYRELIQHGETGLLVPPDNSHSLADTICELLSDPAQARLLGTRARDVALRRFSLERTVRENIEAYQLVVGSPPGADTAGHLTFTSAAPGG